MLKDLLALNKITIDDVELYQLFEVNELGAKWLRQAQDRLFMEEPPKEFLNSELVSFIDGRRSLVREILHSLESIKTLIREYENDNQSRESRQEALRG